MKYLLLISGLCGSLILPLNAQAQKIYKCVGADGAITFSNFQCESDQQETLFKGAAKSPTIAQTNQYTSFEEIQNRFRCDTPAEGLAKFPSKESLIKIAQDSQIYQQQLLAKVNAIRGKLQLGLGAVIPSGKSCEYSFYPGSAPFAGLIVQFRAGSAKEGFVKFGQMWDFAEKLGYPLGEIYEGIPIKERYEWKEKGFRCSLVIADLDVSEDQSAMRVNCKPL